MIRMIRDATTIARRNTIRIGRVPEVMVFVVIQPLMFVLLFAYVFGGSIIFQEATIASSSSPEFLLRQWSSVQPSQLQGWQRMCKKD